jgi:hypothetical protein
MTIRDRMIIVAVLGVGLLAGFWIGILGPKRAEVRRLSTELTAQKQRLDAAQASASDVQRAKDGYEADYAAVANLGKAVPVDAGVPSLLYQLDDETRGAKVSFDSITVGGGADKGAAPAAAAAAPTATGAGALPGGVTTAPFNFTFTGSFFDLQDLLDRINRFVTVRNDAVQVSGRLLTIKDIALAAGEFPKVTATVSANAFQAPAAQAVTSGAAGTAASGTSASTAPSAATQTASSGSSTSGGTQVAGTNTTAGAGTAPASNGTGTTNR